MSTAETKAGLGLISARNPAQPTAESSETRLWALGEFGAPALATEPAYEEIVDACKCALNLWPDAKAAILYGSRVRGDHRADSDWDIAFITSTKTPLPDSVKEVFEGLRKRLKVDFETKVISQAWFLGSADALGNIAAPIAREGRLIAGQCEWPETERDPVLKPHEYMFYRSGALRSIASATSYLADAIGSTDDGIGQFYLVEFVRGTAFAAENFAIIAFARVASTKAYTIPRRHQVDEIAELLDRIVDHDNGPYGTFWKSDPGSRSRELLRNMRVCGDKDQVRWSPELTLDADMISRAAKRLIAAAAFAILEVEALPDPGGLRQAAKGLAEGRWASILESARQLRRSLHDREPDASISTVAAASIGEAIASALEKLADKLYEEMDPAHRAMVNPVIYAVGFRTDGRSLAIADDAESIMDRADEISGTRQQRDRAGSELINRDQFGQALSILGFVRVPKPKTFTKEGAAKFVRNDESQDPGETAMREALAKLLAERQEMSLPNRLVPEPA